MEVGNSARLPIVIAIAIGWVVGLPAMYFLAGGEGLVMLIMFGTFCIYEVTDDILLLYAPPMRSAIRLLLMWVGATCAILVLQAAQAILLWPACRQIVRAASALRPLSEGEIPLCYEGWPDISALFLGTLTAVGLLTIGVIIGEIVLLVRWWRGRRGDGDYHQ